MGRALPQKYGDLGTLSPRGGIIRSEPHPGLRLGNHMASLRDNGSDPRIFLREIAVESRP